MDQVPKLRFPGFNDAWKKHKFSDGISEIGDGLHGTPIYNDNGSIYFINGNNLIDGKVTIDAETKTVDENQQSAIDKSLNKSTILMSINGTIGNLAYYSGEKIKLGKSAAYIKVSQYDKKFVYAYLQAPSAKKYFFDSLTGTTIKNLGLKAIRDMNLMMPDDTNEQKRIGELFSLLDTAINIYQRKLDDIKLLKQSMLQKMFPKDGEDKPEIRFPGFTDAWEQRKLGELSSTTIGEFVIKTKQNPNSSYPVFNGGVSNTGFYNEFNKEGDHIIISARGANAGYINIYKGKYWAGNSCYSVSINESSKQNIDFIYQEMKRNQHLFTDYQQSASIPAVSKADVEKFRIKFPSFNEQQQIGAFFKNLDDLITLHQRKLDGLKELKQALLQQMFI